MADEQKSEVTPEAEWKLPPAARKAVMSGVEPLLAQIKSIDDQLTQIGASASKRKDSAGEALRNAEDQTLEGIYTSTGWIVDLLAHETPDWSSMVPFTYADHLESEIKRLSDELAGVRFLCDAAVTVHLATFTSAIKSEVETLQTQRSAVVSSLGAIHTLVGGPKIDVPDAPKVRGSKVSTGSPSRVTTKTGRHYVVNGAHDHKPQTEARGAATIEGDRYFPANTAISYLAWMFNNAGTEALKSALRNAGVDIDHDSAKPWEATITLEGKTMTVGHHVTPVVEA